MYGIDGRQKLDELTLDHLQGYEHSKPVRIGNAAYQQLQLDIYGEMMDSIYLANKYGDPISYAGWQEVQRVLEWLGKKLERADEGTWEVCGGGAGVSQPPLEWVRGFGSALPAAGQTVPSCSIT